MRKSDGLVTALSAFIRQPEAVNKDKEDVRTTNSNVKRHSYKVFCCDEVSNLPFRSCPTPSTSR